MLRPFGASVETAPNTGFPHYTLGEGHNTDTFNEALGGFLALPNPYITSNKGDWAVSDSISNARAHDDYSLANSVED